MKSWKTQIYGVVQGVGFRPKMFQNAYSKNTFIQISNTLYGVEILFNKKTSSEAHNFCDYLLKNLPPKALIKNHTLQEIPFIPITQHQVVYPQQGESTLMITPDMSWCKACKKEFQNRPLRRQGFMFISCPNCGPRFSLIQKNPFERANTTHHSYPMCEDCQQEYRSLSGNSRSLSQLNMCKVCTFKSSWHGTSELETAQQIQQLSQKIKEGAIALLKGMGGFILTLNYQNKKGIEALRVLKNRPRKPFAIMAKDICWVEHFFQISEAEKKTLASSANPIVLLQPKKNFIAIETRPLLCGDSPKVGVMLASTGYFYEICKANQGAIVATSGNMAGYPLEFDNDAAVQRFEKRLANIWYYERAIHFPQDDSLVHFSPYFQQKIILRRARGLAPSQPELPSYFTEKTILSLGAENKNTICLAYKQQLLISPYLGKMDTVENLERLEYYIYQLLDVCQQAPDIILIDQHPAFQYRHILEKLFQKYPNAILKKIPHHQAHFGAILGEHSLLHSSEKVLGVICDGLGYGKNGEIWGGEFFLYEGENMQRIHHFPKYKYLLHDKMSKTPKLSYMGIFQSTISSSIFAGEYAEIEIKNYLSILPSQPDTTSIGRVFDALCFALGFPYPTQRFEGECALWLENILIKEEAPQHIDFSKYYAMPESWEWKDVFFQIEKDLTEKISQKEIVLKFLNTLAHHIWIWVEKTGATKVALSGGVFQNIFFIDLLLFQAKDKNIELYSHQCLSPNDENISFGQLICEYIKN